MPIELKIDLNAVKTAIRLKTDDNWYGNYTANMKGKLLSHAYYLNKKLEMISSYTEGIASDLIPKTSFNNNFIVNFTTNEECIERINNLSASEVSIYGQFHSPWHKNDLFIFSCHSHCLYTIVT